MGNMSEISSNNKRIEYIDALRGFTMILVVFSHVDIFTFRVGITSLNELFISFRMPLFFFISGFIGYKANIIWNKRTWWEMSKKKLLVQLIPTFVFGLIYAYTYHHIDFSTFIMDVAKYGYWFTICLLEMFLIIYTLNFIVYNANSYIFKKRQFISIVILSLILWGLYNYGLGRFSLLHKFCSIFSLYKTFRYFPYFAFGYLCSINKYLFLKILKNNNVAFIIISLFFIGFYVNKAYISPNMNGNLFFIMMHSIINLIIGFLGSIIVYNTFHVYQDSFTSDKKIGGVLQYIGKRTLDIYLLHFFFLPYLPQIGGILQKGNNYTLELVLGGGISLIVIGICLVVSNVLRTSSILAKYLFGVKNK